MNTRWLAPLLALLTPFLAVGAAGPIYRNPFTESPPALVGITGVITNGAAVNQVLAFDGTQVKWQNDQTGAAGATVWENGAPVSDANFLDSSTALFQSVGTNISVYPTNLTAAQLGTDSVSADELNAGGVEAELEAVLDLPDLQGTLTLGKGGTGSALGAPGSDQILFYDFSGGAVTYLSVGSGLQIVGTTLSATTTATGDVSFTNFDDSTIRTNGPAGSELYVTNITSTLIVDGTIAAADIGANQVDGTHIALGGDAQGNLMYYSGANWVALTPGTAGQVLVTGGGAANPAWASLYGLLYVNGTKTTNANLLNDTFSVWSVSDLTNVVVNATNLTAAHLATDSVSADELNVTGITNELSAVLDLAGLQGVLPMIHGGTGSALTDPGADRILFFDDSAGSNTWLTVGNGLQITGTTLESTGAGVGDVLYTAFATTQFGTNGGVVYIKDGAVVTNFNVRNDLTVTNAVLAQSVTVSNVAASSLLRTDGNKALAAVTVGSGLSFDGTTLTATGGGGSVYANGTQVTNPNFLNDTFSVWTIIDATNLVVNATNLTSAHLATDSVSADELNATGVESELEAVLDFIELQGALTAFAPGQFGTNGGSIYIRDGAIVTNLNVRNDLTVTNAVLAQSVTVSNVTASTLMRVNASKQLASVTVGSGLSFDGTTLSATGSGVGDVLFSDINTNQFNTNNATWKLAVKSGALMTNLIRFDSWSALGTDVDPDISETWYKQLTGDLTLTLSNFSDGQKATLFFENDNVGDHAITWPANTIFLSHTNGPSTTAIGLVTNALAVNIFDVFRRNGTNYVLGPYSRDSAMLTELAGLADPGADRIFFWDESDNAPRFLTLGTGLSITGTTINSSGGSLDLTAFDPNIFSTNSGIVSIKVNSAVTNGTLQVTNTLKVYDLTVSNDFQVVGDLLVDALIVTNGIVAADAQITNTFAAWDGKFTNSLVVPNAAAPTTDATGELAMDTTITDHRPLLQYRADSTNYYVIAIPVADLVTTDGYVIKYNAAGDKFTMAADETGAGGGDPVLVNADAVGDAAGVAITNTSTMVWELDTTTTPDLAKGYPTNLGAAQLATDSVSADELNAAGVEAELEAVLDLPDLQGVLLSGQLPNPFLGSWAITNALTVQSVTVSNVSASSLLRTDANKALAAVTVGTGLSFDGTTLSASAGATAWTDIGDSTADTTIAMAGFETLWTSTLDATDKAVLTIYNADADTANATGFIDLFHDDGASTNVFYLRAYGDADGATTTDYLLSQTEFRVGTGIAANIGGTLGANNLIVTNTAKLSSLNPDRFLTLDASGNIDDTHNSLALYSSLSDPTGTGSAVFSDSPDLTGTVQIRGSLEVTNALTAQSIVVSNVSPSSLLRVDASGALSAVTIGSGISFDGTTLTGSGGATTWTDIGDATGATSIALAGHQTTFTSTLDSLGGAIFKFQNTDADAANGNSFIQMEHNDGADSDVIYLRALGDADGSATTDYYLSQTEFRVGTGIASTFYGSVAITNALTVQDLTVSNSFQVVGDLLVNALIVTNGIVASDAQITNTLYGYTVMATNFLQVGGSVHLTPTAGNLAATNAVQAYTGTFTNALTLNGAPVMTNRVGVYRTIWIPASAMEATTTNAATAQTFTPTGADNMTTFMWCFLNAVTNRVNFVTTMPDEWDLGTVKVKFHWLTTTATAANNVVWQVSAGAIADAGTPGAVLGTAATVTDGSQSQNVYAISAASSALTVGNTPALGKQVLFQVLRDSNNASDTYADTACLVGVQIQYKELTTEPAAW